VSASRGRRRPRRRSDPARLALRVSKPPSRTYSRASVCGLPLRADEGAICAPGSLSSTPARLMSSTWTTSFVTTAVRRRPVEVLRIERRPVAAGREHTDVLARARRRSRVVGEGRSSARQIALIRARGNIGVGPRATHRRLGAREDAPAAGSSATSTNPLGAEAPQTQRGRGHPSHGDNAQPECPVPAHRPQPGSAAWVGPGGGP
jgi:hypothetical protein